MKKNRTTTAAGWLTLTACLTLLAACTREELMPQAPDDGDASLITVTATASMPAAGAQTRLSYEEAKVNETDGLAVYWNTAGETFQVIVGENGDALITFTSQGTISQNTKQADFTGTIPANTQEDTNLYACYIKGTPFMAGQINISFNDQPGTLDGLTTQMYAIAKYKKNEPIAFNFKYLSAAIKLRMTLPDGVSSVHDVRLYGNGVYTQWRADLTGTEPAFNCNYNSYIGTLSGSTFATTDKVATVYLSHVPSALSNVTVYATDSDGKLYEATLPDITLEAGKLYTANLTMGEGEKFSNEGTTGVDGSTADKAYQLSTAADLWLLARRINGPEHDSYINKYYKLTKDIDLSESAQSSDPKSKNRATNNWTPIGDMSFPFTGYFDGGGHTIRNLHVDNANQNFQGLFGYVGNNDNAPARITNVTLENPTVSGDNYIGALIGYALSNVFLSGCRVTGSSAAVSGKVSIGGLVGYFNSSSAIACSSSAKVSMMRSASDNNINFGGLFGHTEFSTVVACYATGEVDTSTQKAGGLIGYVSYASTVVGSYATGAVKGNTNVGGLTGRIDLGSKVSGCYAAGAVNSDFYSTDPANALVGTVAGSLASNNTSLSFCASTQGSVTVGGTSTNVSQVYGAKFGTATASNCATSAQTLADIRSNYVAAGGAQTAWGTFSIHSNGAAQPVYSIEADANGRTLSGAAGDQGIWKAADGGSLKLWWEE